MPAEPTAASIEPILDLIRGPDDALAAHAITAVAHLPLGLDAWREVDHVVRTRLDVSPSPDAVRAAAQVPLTSVRRAVRAIVDDGDTELADAAFDGLVEVRDTEMITRHLDAVVERHGWSAVYGLPTETLAEVDLGRQPADPDEALGWVVTAAKAGRAKPLQRLIESICRGETPRMFDGDPAYVASLLAPARPVPPAIRVLLNEEWSRLDAHSDAARNVGILCQGLVGDDGGHT